MRELLEMFPNIELEVVHLARWWAGKLALETFVPCSTPFLEVLKHRSDIINNWRKVPIRKEL
jgi:hypothetical protein